MAVKQAAQVAKKTKASSEAKKTSSVGKPVSGKKTEVGKAQKSGIKPIGRTASSSKETDLKKSASQKTEKGPIKKATPEIKASKGVTASGIKKEAVPKGKNLEKNNKIVNSKTKKTAEEKPVKKAATTKKGTESKTASAEKVNSKKETASSKAAKEKETKAAPKTTVKKPASVQNAETESLKTAAQKSISEKKPVISGEEKTDSALKSATGKLAGGIPNPASRPPINRAVHREEKKQHVVIAHRRVENKTEKVDDTKTMINYQPEYTRSILDQPTENKGPVYRYSDEELNEFKELILSRLETARKELNYLQGLITRKDEAGTEDTENRYMNMDDGSGAMEREQLAQLASRQIQFIGHLEKALLRIENKTYGICRVTGKLIDKARLRAVPHATLSIEAKKTMSK